MIGLMKKIIIAGLLILGMGTAFSQESEDSKKKRA